MCNAPVIFKLEFWGSRFWCKLQQGTLIQNSNVQPLKSSSITEDGIRMLTHAYKLKTVVSFLRLIVTLLSLNAHVCNAKHDLSLAMLRKHRVPKIHQDRFTCTSANVIYCITYTLCKQLYINKTRKTPKQLIPRALSWHRERQQKHIYPNRETL